jgi:hypothetical protein
MGQMRIHINVLIGKSEGKRQIGRPRRRWNYIRTDVKERVWEGVDWIKCGSGEGQVEGPCEHGTEASGSIKDERFIDQLSDY